MIDVSASMPGRSAAFAALRVTYDPRVTIPDLAGVQDDEAADRLEALGLEVSLDAVGGLFDELRSGPRRVCESDPPAGYGRRPRQHGHAEDREGLLVGLGRDQGDLGLAALALDAEHDPPAGGVAAAAAQLVACPSARPARPPPTSRSESS